MLRPKGVGIRNDRVFSSRDKARHCRTGRSPMFYPWISGLALLARNDGLGAFVTPCSTTDTIRRIERYLH